MDDKYTDSFQAKRPPTRFKVPNKKAIANRLENRKNDSCNKVVHLSGRAAEKKDNGIIRLSQRLIKSSPKQPDQLPLSNR